MLDEFSFLVCSSNYPLRVLLLKNEQTNDRFIKAFPSLDGIDEYECNTLNKHDMLFLCVPATYIHRHTKKCGKCVYAHWSRKERQKKRCVEEREKEEN